MIDFSKAKEAQEAIEEPKKKGRPAGSKNKAKAVTAEKTTDCPYVGTFGRIQGVVGVRMLDNVKYRIFNSGNIGLVNLRIELAMADGSTLVAGPASPTFLIDRDDAWRKETGKSNNRSALHISELPNWSDDDDDESANWEIITAQLGDKKVSE